MFTDKDSGERVVKIVDRRGCYREKLRLSGATRTASYKARVAAGERIKEQLAAHTALLAQRIQASRLAQLDFNAVLPRTP
jgi:hypothetical protein